MYGMVGSTVIVQRYRFVDLTLDDQMYFALYTLYKEAKDRRGNEIKLNVFSIVCFGVLLAVDVNYYMDEDHEGKMKRWMDGRRERKAHLGSFSYSFN